MHGFKSAILAIFQFWQNGTFEEVFPLTSLMVHSVCLCEIDMYLWRQIFIDLPKYLHQI